MDAQTRARLDRIDGRICTHRVQYLEAVWHDENGDAHDIEVEVDRLLDLRNIVERGLLTAAQVTEVDTL